MLIAFSMYSKIPMPKTKWEEENFKYSFAFFPLVGVIIGAAIYYIFNCMLPRGFNGVFFATVAIFVNVAITGGLHIDGFCDVMDALSSHKPREEKLKIMKDPNVGAFAVIYTAVLFVIWLGAYTQIFYFNKYLLAVIIAFAVSRMLTGLAVIQFPCAKDNGLAAIFAKGASKSIITAVLIGMLLLAFLLLVALFSYIGLVFLVASTLAFIWFYYFSKRIFGGITGDLAGFFLNIFETVILLLAAFMGGSI